MDNLYMPSLSKIKKVTKHTNMEYSFQMEFSGDVKPGQFFEISIPKFGEAPISVSGIGEDYVEFTIRKVGKVTNEIFENYEGSSLFLRGPYGNGFDVNLYKNKQLIIVAGGTAVSPVKGVISYFTEHLEETKSFHVIAGFKSPNGILFKEDIAKWQAANKNFILTVDKGTEGYTGNEGMVTKYIPDIPIENVEDVSVIVVGPPIMMKFSVEAFLKRNVPEKNIWISHERKMCCGLGKCGHCRIGGKYVCLDGPVFNYTEGKLLID